MHIYPDYYPHFRCIASACRHNCCIGWEIDIDETSLARYRQTELCRHIEWQDTPHFILQNERCPFLNNDNLCKLILDHGEDMLCDICKEHPRFHNALPGRTESGLGLCCEAAGALILGQKEPMHLPEAPTDDAIILLRDRILSLLQDRTLPIDRRIENMLTLCGVTAPELNVPLFLSLERLEEGWTDRLHSLRTPTPDFAAHMEGRESEYEQFCVYLLYRHFANAPTLEQAAAVARLISLCYRLIYSLGSTEFGKTGKFTFADQVELCRQFSAEVEYSDENTDTLLAALY